MFSHKNFRPAFAGVGNHPEKLSAKNRYEGMLREAAGTDSDDFNGFDSSADERPRRPAPRKKQAPKFNLKLALIAGI